nr:phage tail protein [uncultured Streptococcus sp.]
MITFIDEKGTEHSALVAYSVTNAVNGELSVKGTIYTNDKVLHGIDRGWRFRLDDEYYRVTYAKPNDAGRQIEVEFDAVHQFFYDMSKSMVYDTLNGSKSFETYLQAIFSGSGYTYNLETTVGSIRKENFGNKSRLSLFNDIIKAAGLEFSVRGHVVRILKRIGTDLSAIVRKDFNMNELKIEKNINSFVTYQRGLGAWKDDEDHSKGRYESEYESPLAKIYGRIEAEPVVDERYKETGKLLERLKENVDKSYKVSVEIDMEDLSRAGYQLSRPNPGDYIMAINETLGFSQKVRIVSFTSEYDVGGNLISRKVVCNDIGSVQRRASEMSGLARSVQDVAAENAKAIATATKALVSADGKNTIYFGESKPRDEPVGTLRKGDQLYLKEGEKTNLYFWNGAEWELNPLEMDIVKFRKEYESKTKEINQSMATQTQQTAQALRTAGANASAIEAAKGAITKLNQDLAGAKQTNQSAIDRLKSDFASAQQAASDQTALLRSDLANIRTKQSQSESEITKQVAALNVAKTELADVKSAQATYEQTTTRRLAELTNLADGKASKSELVQTSQELSSKIASVSVGGTNLLSYINFNAGGYYQNSLKRDNNYTYSNLIEIKSTDYILQVWELEANAKKTWAGLQFFDEQQNPLANGYSTFWFNGYLKKDLKPPQNARYLAVSFENSILEKTKAKFKLETGTLPTDWSPAPEDVESQISAVESTFKQKADSLEAGVNRLTEGLKTKADSSALTMLSDSIKQSVKSLETDTQNKLDSKLSTAVFEVRASGIHQEILNATKDKADKTLVTAEAGKLREELASLSVGGRNLLKGSKGPFKPNKNPANFDNQALYHNETSIYLVQNEKYRISAKTDGVFDSQHNGSKESDNVVLWLMDKAVTQYQIVSDAKTGTTGTEFVWNRPTGTYHLRVNTYQKAPQRLKSVWEVKVEQGSFKTDWSPAPEDADGLITEAKATFERTAQGLRTDLSAVQAYINADGTRAEALRSYSREETARQLTAERKLIEAGYVGKATYAEDVRGLTRRFEELKTSSETKLAEYRQTVEGQFAIISSQISGKANQTDFQRVQETSKLYERLIGSTEKEVADKVSRMALTNELFQVEVSKNQGLRTVQSQLAGSWSIKNLNSASDILGQLNLNPDGSVSINEGLISIGDKTHIKNGVIKNAMIESMLADKIAAGTLNAANVNIVNLNANKIVGLDANFIKSKIELAFIEWMRGKTISAQNDAMQINLNDGHILFYNDDASIKRVLAGYPTQFIRYENKVENGQNHGRTIIGSNRNGTNAWKSVSFAGLVIDNNSNNSVDKIYQFGDYNHMRHAQGDDGWNFSVVTQTMTPGVWNKNSEIWARHFVVPRNTKGDTDSPTQFIRLEESVAAIWNILNHAASGQVTMTQAMKNLINSRKAAWDIVRNVG